MTTSNGDMLLREDNPADLLLLKNIPTTITIPTATTTNTTNQSQSILPAATSSVYNYANNNNNSSNINLNSNINGIAGPSLVVSSTPIKPNLAPTERFILPGILCLLNSY